jgi:hypothetical protein
MSELNKQLRDPAEEIGKRRPSRPAELAESSDVTAKPKKRARGRPFPKGGSGNPGGRPKDVFGIAELARSMAAEAIETLAEIMRNIEAPPAARIAAINGILDRGLGKPMQSTTMQHLGEDGQPTKPVFEVNVIPYETEPAVAPKANGRAESKDDPPATLKTSPVGFTTTLVEFRDRLKKRALKSRHSESPLHPTAPAALTSKGLGAASRLMVACETP